MTPLPIVVLEMLIHSPPKHLSVCARVCAEAINIKFRVGGGYWDPEQLRGSVQHTTEQDSRGLSIVCKDLFVIPVGTQP